MSRIELLDDTARDLLKRALWRLQPKLKPSRLGLILGCQRSGTNMLNDAFGRGWSCKAFGEDGGLALGPGVDHHLRWRWQPLPAVDKILRSYRAPLLVAKPIVESQRALELLDYFPHAKIIWVYRHYLGVAQSSLDKFGVESSVYNLGAVLDPKRNAHWYSQNLAAETRKLVELHYDPDRPVPDLKALSWYVRNSLFFQLELEYNRRVLLCKYEDLVANPVAQMQRLYQFLDVEYPGQYTCSRMNASSVHKGDQLPIADGIRHLCDELLERLDRARAAGPA